MEEPQESGALARVKPAVWVVAGVLATVIGAASVVVPWIASSSQRTTAADSLVVDPPAAEPTGLPSSQPLAAAPEALIGLEAASADQSFPTDAHSQQSFAIPADAPWQSFPDDGPQSGEAGMFGCSQAQMDWLGQHDVVADDVAGLLDLTNSATTGGALSIRSVRAEGAFAPQDPARIVVECEGFGSGAGDDYTVIQVMLGSDAPATVIASSVLPVGTIFVRDLAPGEIGQVILSLSTTDPTQDFTGRIVADVVAGEDEATVTLGEGMLWRSASAIRSGMIIVGGQDGVIRCAGIDVDPSAPLFEDSGWGPSSTMRTPWGADAPACAPTDIAGWVRELPRAY
ncbi:hypothetical protein [Microbacterium radiodurans]|uniref:Uncharacterized protein n=1 Tax=Microbacterium radiodurans TaxID=661398 RepID=A0A5J5INS5_9MICO|nr:hypothetical protein [Microbacterium radiodurans]KAA9083795.1 hypothetical protein F6B42_14730 [Microbacterium radiodurans]